MVVYDDTSAEPVRVFDSGVVLKDPETFGEYRLTYRTGDIVSPRIDAAEPLSAELRDFCEAVMHGTTPRSSAALGLQVVQMIEAADRSHALGRSERRHRSPRPVVARQAPRVRSGRPRGLTPRRSPPQRLPARHSRADGVELEPGVSVRIALDEQPPELRQDDVRRVPLSELLDKHTESVPGLLRIELVQPRDDLVDPMEQLHVIETRQMLFRLDPSRCAGPRSS